VLSRFFAENHVFRLKITFFAWKSRFFAENRVHPPCQRVFRVEIAFFA